MEKRKTQNPAGLLPDYFKRIGIIVILLALVPAVIVKVMDVELTPANKELFRQLTMHVFILGLLFVAGARDKDEDEMTIALRLKSMGFAFIWAVLSVVVEPLTDALFKNKSEAPGAEGLVVSMLFIYLIFYYLQKKGR